MSARDDMNRIYNESLLNAAEVKIKALEDAIETIFRCSRRTYMRKLDPTELHTVIEICHQKFTKTSTFHDRQSHITDSWRYYLAQKEVTNAEA